MVVGRPNVGKSTLFNRLLGRRRALVHDRPGVTRDRIEEECLWHVGGRALAVRLVDTGGLGEGTFSREIEGQVGLALEGADAVLLVFDGRAGITAEDREVVRGLRRSGGAASAPWIAVVNKIDTAGQETLVAEFHELGVEPVLGVSAEHARGIDDLQHLVAEGWGEAERASPPPGDKARTDAPRIAVLGKPNVGKSTLVNALLGAKRMITSPIAGTTVDAIDSSVTIGGRPYVLTDTAGVRRKSRTERGVEVLSVVQTRKALENSDIAILVLDGATGVADQDEKIAGLIEGAGIPVILLVNKWDTQVRKGFGKKEAAESVRAAMPFLHYAPIVFGSGLRGEGFGDLAELADEILQQKAVKVGTHELTQWIREAAEVQNPRGAKFYLCHQSGRHPPTFVCHVNDPRKIHFSLERHIVNGIRKRWGFMGSPVRLKFVDRASRPDDTASK